MTMKGELAEVIPLHMARLGVRPKTLPKRVFTQTRTVSRDPAAWAGVLTPKLEQLGAVMRALEPIASHADRMRVLAAAASLHDDSDEAAWLLGVSVEDEKGRCGRCGVAPKLSRWRHNP